MKARKLLFETTVPLGRPLFENAADLAREIVKQNPDKYKGKDHRSLGSFLNQVVIQKQRACPTNLAQAIQLAVRARLVQETEEEREAWVERVGRALEIDRLTWTSPEALEAESLYYELENTAEEAKEHFIITTRPLEQIVAPKAETLRQILLRRLGLFDLREDPKTSYTFCLPGPEFCAAWWVSLFRENRREAHIGGRPATPTEFAKKLQSLDESSHLRTLAIRPIICGIPVVVFDPEGDDPTGFVFFYHTVGSENPNKVSIAKMGGPYLEEWRSGVYWPIVENKEEAERVKVTSVPLEAAHDARSS